MKFKDFDFKGDNHFIAMQYYGLILNRTYLVIMTSELLIGIKVNGLVSVESGGNIIAKELSATMTIKGDLQNPNSYVKKKYIDRVQEFDLLDGSILTLDKSNFLIQRAEIKNAWYDPKKKWGMGYYPHDGKVYIETNAGKKRELIILGNQSGQKIANQILTR
jgi:hypothetical protein